MWNIMPVINMKRWPQHRPRQSILKQRTESFRKRATRTPLWDISLEVRLETVTLGDGLWKDCSASS